MIERGQPGERIARLPDEVVRFDVVLAVEIAVLAVEDRATRVAVEVVMAPADHALAIGAENQKIRGREVERVGSGCLRLVSRARRK